MKIPLRNPDEFHIDPEDFELMDRGPSSEVINILMQDFMNRQAGKVAPDTIGADYFFIEGFITGEMAWEFSLVQQIYEELIL